MLLSVNGIETFVATGGREFDKSLPTIVLLHGAGFDQTTWALHSPLVRASRFWRAGAGPAGAWPLKRRAAPYDCRDGRLDRGAARRRRCRKGKTRSVIPWDR